MKKEHHKEHESKMMEPDKKKKHEKEHEKDKKDKNKINR